MAETTARTPPDGEPDAHRQAEDDELARVVEVLERAASVEAYERDGGTLAVRPTERGEALRQARPIQQDGA